MERFAEGDHDRAVRGITTSNSHLQYEVVVALWRYSGLKAPQKLAILNCTFLKPQSALPVIQRPKHCYYERINSPDCPLYKMLTNGPICDFHRHSDWIKCL